MREAIVAETLAAATAEDAVALLHELLHAREPDPVALDSVTAALAGRLTYDLRATLYAAAKDANLPEVARLFFTTSTDEPPPEPEQPLSGAGRALTLGERKSLARAHRREVLVRLLRDPDAAVIKNLLLNPRLTERDVLTVASRRPVRGDVLRVVAASRWITRYHVRRALVMNPHTPAELAIRLLGALVEADLRAVAFDANLAVAVRDQARVLLSD